MGSLASVGRKWRLEVRSGIRGAEGEEDAHAHTRTKLTSSIKRKYQVSAKYIRRSSSTSKQNKRRIQPQKAADFTARKGERNKLTKYI